MYIYFVLTHYCQCNNQVKVIYYKMQYWKFHHFVIILLNYDNMKEFVSLFYDNMKNCNSRNNATSKNEK